MSIDCSVLWFDSLLTAALKLNYGFLLSSALTKVGQDFSGMGWSARWRRNAGKMAFSTCQAEWAPDKGSRTGLQMGMAPVRI
jgi:hypothetical protein